MRGYYESHPTHHLERPLVLVSFVNRMTRTVAHNLAATTGLPLSLLDELVEHRVGASAHEIVGDQGLAVWRDVEKRELGRELRSKPPPILALGEGGMDDPESLSLILDSSELVYLHLPQNEACEWASRQSAGHSASLWAEVKALGGVPEESMRALFESRHFTYGLAHLTLDVSGRRLAETTNKLLNRLVPVS
jgi:shikimate kinase